MDDDVDKCDSVNHIICVKKNGILLFPTSYQGIHFIVKLILNCVISNSCLTRNAFLFLNIFNFVLKTNYINNLTLFYFFSSSDVSLDQVKLNVYFMFYGMIMMELTLLFWICIFWVWWILILDQMLIRWLIAHQNAYLRGNNSAKLVECLTFLHIVL